MTVYIWREPVQRLKLVLLRDCWVADNGDETAVFATYGEALRFAHTRWHATDADVVVISPPRRSESKRSIP